jgi:hypothetical protein
MERFKVNARELANRAWARLAALRARFAASRAGIKWAALPPRTQRLVAGGGAGVLALVLVAGLVLGPLSGHGAGSQGGSAGTPGVAAVSPSESAVASASPVANATPVAAKVLATVDCGDGTSPAVAGGRLYVLCDDDDENSVNSTKAIAIDLASGNVVKNYKLPISDKFEPDSLFVDGGLWVGATDSEQSGDDQYETVRLDLTSGSKKSDLKGIELIADLGGTIVATDEGGTPYKINAATGAKSFWNSNNVQTVVEDDSAVAKCGFLWDLSSELGGLAGVDLANGKATTMAVSVGGGFIVDVLQSGKTCWAEIGTSPNQKADSSGGSEVIAQLGATCMGPASQPVAQTYQVGDTFWEILSDGISQVDPAGRKVGPTYLVNTNEYGWLTLADGQVWLATSAGLARLDIPVDQMAPAPTPASLSCAGIGEGPVDDGPIPTDSPSPSPSPSPSLSPSPSISPSPSPAPTGTPVATATASPTNSPAPSVSPDVSVAP